MATSDVMKKMIVALTIAALTWGVAGAWVEEDKKMYILPDGFIINYDVPDGPGSDMIDLYPEYLKEYKAFPPGADLESRIKTLEDRVKVLEDAQIDWSGATDWAIYDLLQLNPKVLK